jgi:glycyl-tRNA synthetase
MVTVRDRDTEAQKRIPISDLKEYLENYYKWVKTLI